MSQKLDSFLKQIQAALYIVTFMGILYTMTVFLSEWKDLPEKVTNLESAINNFNLTVEEISRRNLPTPVEFLSANVNVLNDELYAGETLWVAFYARANTTCDRNIRVQFFSEDTMNYLRQESITRAIKSAVSRDYQLLVVPVETFLTMAPGTYRYSATIEVVDCQGFVNQRVGLSERFTILEDV